MRGGDTVIVANGTYTEGVSGDSMPNGTSSAYTTVQAANFRGVTLRPPTIATYCFVLHGNKHFLTFDGFVCDRTGDMPSGPQAVGGIDINAQNGLSDIKIINAEVHHINGDTYSCSSGCNFATTAALGLSWPTSNVIVDNLYVHDIGYNQTAATCPAGSCPQGDLAYGIYLSGKGYTVQNSTFENMTAYAIHGNCGGGDCANTNDIHNNTLNYTGEILAEGPHWQIYNNVLSHIGYGLAAMAKGNQANGIHVGQFGPADASGTRIYNNTLYHVREACLVVGTAPSGPVAVKNNICLQTGNDTLVSFAGARIDTATNLAGVDPGFVDTSAARPDLHLAGMTGPAWNHGTMLDLGSPDHDGGARPQSPATTWAIGAYEVGSTAPPPPAQPLPAPRNLRLVTLP